MMLQNTSEGFESVLDWKPARSRARAKSAVLAARLDCYVHHIVYDYFFWLQEVLQEKLLNVLLNDIRGARGHLHSGAQGRDLRLRRGLPRGTGRGGGAGRPVGRRHLPKGTGQLSEPESSRGRGNAHQRDARRHVPPVTLMILLSRKGNLILLDEPTVNLNQIGRAHV